MQQPHFAGEETDAEKAISLDQDYRATKARAMAQSHVFQTQVSYAIPGGMQGPYALDGPTEALQQATPGPPNPKLTKPKHQRTNP